MPLGGLLLVATLRQPLLGELADRLQHREAGLAVWSVAPAQDSVVDQLRQGRASCRSSCRRPPRPLPARSPRRRRPAVGTGSARCRRAGRGSRRSHRTSSGAGPGGRAGRRSGMGGGDPSAQPAPAARRRASGPPPARSPGAARPRRRRPTRPRPRSPSVSWNAGSIARARATKSCTAADVAAASDCRERSSSPVRSIGHRQRPHGELVVAGEVEARPAGGEDRQPGTGREQIRHQRCRVAKMLEVVEDQQEALVPDDLRPGSRPAVDAAARPPRGRGGSWSRRGSTSRIEASATNRTPSAKAGPSSVATRTARRLLPTPPGPRRVTSEAPWLPRRSTRAATSSSRPIRGVRHVGRADARPHCEQGTAPGRGSGGAALARRHGARTRRLEGGEVRRRDPVDTGRFDGGKVAPGDGAADCALADAQRRRCGARREPVRRTGSLRKAVCPCRMSIVHRTGSIAEAQPPDNRTELSGRNVAHAATRSEVLAGLHVCQSPCQATGKRTSPSRRRRRTPCCRRSRWRPGRRQPSGTWRSNPRHGRRRVGVVARIQAPPRYGRAL